MDIVACAPFTRIFPPRHYFHTFSFHLKGELRKVICGNRLDGLFPLFLICSNNGFPGSLIFLPFSLQICPSRRSCSHIWGKQNDRARKRGRISRYPTTSYFKSSKPSGYFPNKSKEAYDPTIVAKGKRESVRKYFSILTSIPNAIIHLQHIRLSWRWHKKRKDKKSVRPLRRFLLRYFILTLDFVLCGYIHSVAVHITSLWWLFQVVTTCPNPFLLFLRSPVPVRCETLVVLEL